MLKYKYNKSRDEDKKERQTVIHSVILVNRIGKHTIGQYDNFEDAVMFCENHKWGVHTDGGLAYYPRMRIESREDETSTPYFTDAGILDCLKAAIEDAAKGSQIEWKVNCNTSQIIAISNDYVEFEYPFVIHIREDDIVLYDSNMDECFDVLLMSKELRGRSEYYSHTAEGIMKAVKAIVYHFYGTY